MKAMDGCQLLDRASRLETRDFSGLSNYGFSGLRKGDDDPVWTPLRVVALFILWLTLWTFAILSQRIGFYASTHPVDGAGGVVFWVVHPSCVLTTHKTLFSGMLSCISGRDMLPLASVEF